MKENDISIIKKQIISTADTCYKCKLYAKFYIDNRLTCINAA